MCTQNRTTGGLSGYLQQEFRELELLNEITRLRWECDLRSGVGGNTRSTLLKSYMKVYGKKSCPADVHSAIRWGQSDDTAFDINYDDDNDFVWRSLDKSKKQDCNKEGQRIQEDTRNVNCKKRKADTQGFPVRLDIIPPTKKSKMSSYVQKFRGLRWNAATQSCAYDSLISVLSNVYYLNARDW
ncbi:hypothetical protein PENSPDRAFT_587801, partial [Peniophora sp. CONT]